MPHSEPPVNSGTLTPLSHSCSKSTLPESYVLDESSPSEPTITTNTTSNEQAQEHPPTTSAGTTVAATTTAHLLSHMHLSPGANSSYPSHQMTRYLRRPIPSTTQPPTATPNLHDLRQSLLSSHHLDLLLQEESPAVPMLDEHSVENIPIEEFLPSTYYPPEAEEHEQGAEQGTVQDGYAIQRFLSTGMEEEANVVYARRVGS